VKLDVDFVVSTLALGFNFTLALSFKGTVYGWGADTLFHEFGVDASGKLRVISQNAANIMAGKASACYSQGNELYSWGENSSYQLGLGTTDQVATPRIFRTQWRQIMTSNLILFAIRSTPPSHF
jgi:alpha-tubulin suppressor-like RCC1 family protein